MVLMHKEAVFYSSASKYIEVGMFSYYFIFFRMEDTSNSFVYLDFRDMWIFQMDVLVWQFQKRSKENEYEKML